MPARIVEAVSTKCKVRASLRKIIPPNAATGVTLSCNTPAVLYFIWEAIEYHATYCNPVHIEPDNTAYKIPIRSGVILFKNNIFSNITKGTVRKKFPAVT